VWAVELADPLPREHLAAVRWADDGRHVLIGRFGCVYALRVPAAAAPSATPP
jgi:hypothetical protein